MTLTGSAVWLKENSSSPADIPYIPPDKDIDYGNPALEGVIRFWTFIILYQVSHFWRRHTWTPLINNNR